MSKRFALLIGNVRYQDGRLSAPVSGKTLTALADLLRDPQIGRFDDVFVQVNNTAVEVQLAIAEFFEVTTSPNDTILIYFAGHVLHHKGQPYLAQWDTFTESYLEATTMQPEYLMRRLAKAPARQKLMVLDVCASHMLADEDALPEDDEWLLAAFSAPNLVTMTAVQTQSSTAHSDFTNALIDGLQSGQARPNDDGVVTAQAWFDHAETAVPDPVRLQLRPEALAKRFIVAALSDEKLALLPPPPIAGDGETAVADDGEPDGRKKWAIVAVLLLLVLFVGGGGLFASGLIGQTAAPEMTTVPIAAITEEPTEAATATATETAVPSDTATPTQTATATKPGAKDEDETLSSVTPTMTQMPVVTNTVSPTGTIEATQTVTVSVTPLPVGVHVVRQRIFMRSGPAINFRIEEYLDQGTAVTVLGQTPSGEWFNIELADGRTGWVYSEMVESPADEAPEDIPEVVTMPAPVNEFYDFSAGETEDGLTVAVSHVYVGTVGENGTFTAKLLPETNLITTEYVNSDELGLGQFVVNFTKTGAGAYTSTAVEVCMVSAAGQEFFCDTFPVRIEWE